MKDTMTEAERELWEPLLSLFSRSERRQAEAVWASAERDEMFAWGVQSGYFGWVRHHPGETPTLAQVCNWLLRSLMPMTDD